MCLCIVDDFVLKTPRTVYADNHKAFFKRVEGVIIQNGLQTRNVTG
jgi:hypothetical protein